MQTSVSDSALAVSAASSPSQASAAVPAASSSASTTLPPIIYIRTQDSDTLFAVHSRLFTEPGCLPEHSLLRYMFNGITKQAKPMYERHGIPVYFVAMPSKVFAHMLHALNLPDAVDLVVSDFPRELSLELWQKYFQYFGFENVESKSAEAHDFDDDAAAAADNDEVSGAPREQRMARLKKAIAAVSQNFPRYAFYRRIAHTLVDYITENHPQWDSFSRGLVSRIECEFVNTFNPNDGNHSFILDIPNDDVEQDGVSIALELGIVAPIFAEYEGGLIDENPGQNYFKDCMTEKFEGIFEATIRTVVTRNTKRKTPIKTANWPSENLLLAPRCHDVVKLIIRPAGY